jgi:hypothetical protein
MKKILFNSALLFCMAIIFNACQKDKDKTPDQTIVGETSTTQSNFDDIQKEMEDVMEKKNNGTLRVAANPCYTVLWDSSAAHLITLTYDGSYCNGRTRSGQILIHYTDYFRNTGAVITITLNNFYINGNRVQGKKVVTNNGNGSGKYSFSVVVSDSTAVGTAGTGFAKITFTDGSYTNWKSSRTHTWDQGSSTPLTLLDDEWVISGTFSGLSREGVNFTGSLSSLRYKIACWYALIFYPESGSLSVTTTEGTRSLDFGTGDCDKKAKFTALNGKTYDIDLK